jgi:3-methyladenine DNA glycosylase AlkC
MTAMTTRRVQISRGEIETRNLSECLAVDFVTLFGALFPDAPRSAISTVSAAGRLGILARMDAVAGVLFETYGADVVALLQSHASDTARGWGAFVVGRLPQLGLLRRLAMIKTFADDEHFGVREWAWMAVRKQISSQIEASIEALVPWAEDPSPKIRRFASESTRPRGVWAAHIPVLKKTPEIALPILEPLRADSERYVQDSVANWLNDAAKSQPQWVRQICKRWEQSSRSDATAYITKRAQRSLK